MAVDRGTMTDLVLRLDGTICRWKGHPYYVSCGVDYPNVVLYKLNGRSQQHLVVDHRDDNFDDSSPPLGYLNTANQALYLKRMPSRQQSQGLRAASVALFPSTTLRTEWFRGLPMESCILGRYPSYSQVVERTLVDATIPNASQAVSRNIAIGKLDHRVLGLYYKTRLVATKTTKGWEYIDNPDRDIIKELIDSEGVLGDTAS